MSDDETYPAGPSGVPADLTRPSAAYRRHAYLAVAGVVVFVAAYFALAGWFAWTSFRMLAALRRAPDQAFVLILGGVAAGFLAVFMLKAVIFIRRGAHDDIQLEVTAAEHPRLFRFLHRLADEAGAPRPHRVFLSPRVNAAVFYDLSLANLILPSKKNLEIGLGLINVLTLGELKAVLAHELGHFAQRTMAVGRWVYTAQQIAGHIVVKRDALDRMLQWISTIDLRVAWIGWILRLVVWSIRSLVDTLFGWVVLAERALSREMELQADLVAVSLTGSDALIHALHRLRAADDAMDRAVAFAAAEQRAGRAVADGFAIQTRMLERKRYILDDPGYGQVPPLPASPAQHRVFEAQLAHPPQMWASHPPSELREHNAKRVYVACALDDRPGWVLFDDAAALRAAVTARLYTDEARAKTPAPVPIAESLAKLDESYDRRYFDPTYRGVYLGRSVCRDAARLDALYGDDPAAAELPAALEALYPASLAGDLARIRELAEEKDLLEALRRGVLEAPGKLVRFRGQDRKRKELPHLIEDVERELTAARRVVSDHDRRVRSVHLAAARTLSPPWHDYLRGLAAVMHYADHAEADLEDAAGHLGNVFAVVTADRKVSDAERARLVGAAADVHLALDAIYSASAQVVLGDAVAAKLDVPSWREGMGEFDLPAPHEFNIGDWLDVARSWIGGATAALSALYSAALEELLRAEELVALAVKSGQPAPPPPPPPRVPDAYTVLTPDKERPRQTRLGWWDRFQTADGFLPGAARFAVAGLIVGGVVLAGRAVGGDATVYVYNGLSRPVVVDVGDTRVEVGGRSMAEVSVDSGTQQVTAHTTEGRLIEAFQASASDDYGRYAYNVGGAAVLMEMKFFRDAGHDTTPRLITQRWFEVDADRVHATPPQRLEAKSDVARVSVLTALELQPEALVGQLDDPAGRTRLIVARARWEPADAHDLGAWIAMVPSDHAADVIRTRLTHDPDDVMGRRLEQDRGEATACDRHRAEGDTAATDPNLQYLAARCEPDPDQRDRRFIELAARFPGSPWPAYAAAVALEDQGRWAEALDGLDRVHLHLPAMRGAITLRLARLRRLLASSQRPLELDDLTRESAQLRMFEELETGPRPDATLAGYWYLAHGQPGQAADAANDDADLVLLAAGSDGAPQELVERALALPSAALSPQAAAVGFALAARNGQDPLPYLERLSANGGDGGGRARGFLEALAADARNAIATADTQLLGCDARTRGIAYVAAVVLLGDACPPAWREHARRALFAVERPFFKPRA